MKLGPIEVIWNTQTSYRRRLRSVVHEHMTDLLNTDAGLRAIIARCGRSAAKDYLAELIEPPPLYAYEPGPITCEDMGHDPRIHSPSGRAEIAREAEGTPS